MKEQSFYLSNNTFTNAFPQIISVNIGWNSKFSRFCPNKKILFCLTEIEKILRMKRTRIGGPIQ